MPTRVLVPWDDLGVGCESHTVTVVQPTFRVGKHLDVGNLKIQDTSFFRGPTGPGSVLTMSGRMSVLCFLVRAWNRSSERLFSGRVSCAREEG